MEAETIPYLAEISEVQMPSTRPTPRTSSRGTPFRTTNSESLKAAAHVVSKAGDSCHNFIWPSLNNQSDVPVSSVRCTIPSGPTTYNWPDLALTPASELRSNEPFQPSWIHPSNSPTRLQSLGFIQERLDDAIDLYGRQVSDAPTQSIAINGITHFPSLSCKATIRFNPNYSARLSTVPFNTLKSSTNAPVNTKQSRNPTTQPVLRAPASRSTSNSGTLHNKASRGAMVRESHSRANAGEGIGIRLPRRDEFEGTNIMPPMFRDEYIKADADGSSTGGASASIEGNGNNRRAPERQSADESQPMTGVLPVEKSFPIQIGSELFRLSGASIMSDAPSYFSEFFVKQLNQSENGEVRTLYIDRDPATFQDICRHLQGYFVGPRDGVHYVRLFADAQFYNLPRLISQLFESPIYIEVGGKNFQVPRDLFGAPGNQSNFFSLGFGALFAEPVQVFPGLERHNLLRPPSIQPSIVTHRSAETFAEILFLLREYPLRIRDEEHRQALLNDAKYYHFRNLEQKLIHHKLSYNLARRRSEITIRLEDIKQSGISFQPDEVPLTNDNPHEPPPPIGGYVNYARPYLEEPPAELILEIGSDSTEIDLRDMRADFHGRTSTIKDRISSLFQVVANKMNLKTTMPLGLMMANGGATALPKSPGFTPLSEHRVKVSIGPDAAIMLDDEEFVMPSHATYQDTSNGVENNFSMQKTDFMQAIGNTPSPVSMPWQNLPQDHPAMLARSASTGQQPQSHPSNQNAVKQQQLLQYQQQLASRKRKRREIADVEEETGTWIVSKGQWRLRIRPRVEQTMGGNVEPRFEVVMCAVKLQAARGERGRNLGQGFLV